MEVVTGAMSTLLPKLADLVEKEYNMHSKMREEILFLKTELEHMEAALLKVSKASVDEPPDIQVKLWARDVRELSYDLEDSIDAFMVRIDMPATSKAKPYSLRGFVDRTVELFRRANVRRKIASDIQGFKKNIIEVSERRDRYKVDTVAAMRHNNSPKRHDSSIDILHLSALYKKATELVGTEERADELVKMLTEWGGTAQQLKIVSIAGFGGLGKTTLANLVYDKLKEQFDCRAFVRVSLNPKIKNIFVSMLRQFGHRECEVNWDVEQLIDELRKFLQSKRYFIVIDDLWDTSVWKTIQYALIENECGSRVITTTRNLEVAENVGGVHKLQPLSFADSRKLFYLRIFGIEDKCPPNDLADVSEDILEKCGGVPLAIITIASMLASKNGMENEHKYWSKVCQSLGSGLEDSPDVKNMRRILSISYYDLPPHLKTCMLYLSSYPEDSLIDIEELIWNWVGEGFIRYEQGKFIYEVGMDYVEELISRSMIEPAYIDKDRNKATSCRVHDMVLDLITHLSNEDGFLTRLCGRQTKNLPKRIRRLFIHNRSEEDIKQLSTVSFCYLRSLTVSKRAFKFLPTFSTIQVLRVLDLTDCEHVDNHNFKDICNLFHLRSLRLHSRTITMIPKKIRNLQFLQVLDLSRTEIDKLPPTFVQLKQLLYFCVDSLMRIPDGFGSLKYLQVLDGTVIVESPAMMHNLTGLAELRHVELKFNAWDESYEKPFLQCLSSLTSLEYLEVAGYCGNFESPYERLKSRPQLLRCIKMASSTIGSVPIWMSSLSALSILHISLLSLGAKELHVLGSIPCLSYLNLSVEEPTQARDKRIIINKAYPFSCLTKFEICNMTGLVFEQGAMPKLQTLVLTFGVLETLDQLGDFDFGLKHLSSLVHVNACMGCPKGKSDNVKVAEDAIRNKLSTNPDMPPLCLSETNFLKVHIHYKGCDRKIMDVLTKVDGVYEKSVDPKQAKVTVLGDVDPTTIIEKLNEAGMQGQLLSHRYVYQDPRPIWWYPPWSKYPYPHYMVPISEEDPNACSVM